MSRRGQEEEKGGSIKKDKGAKLHMNSCDDGESGLILSARLTIFWRCMIQDSFLTRGGTLIHRMALLEGQTILFDIAKDKQKGKRFVSAAPHGTCLLALSFLLASLPNCP